MHRLIAIAAGILLGAAVFFAARPVTHLKPPSPKAPPAVESAPAVTATASTASRPEAVQPVPVPAPAGPWPLDFPPASWPEPVRRTYLQLMERVTLDFANESATAVIDWFAAQLRVQFVIDPDVLPELQGRHISMRVSGIIADGCLRLLLGPTQLACEIQEDGTLRLGREDQIKRVYEKEAMALLNRQKTLKTVSAALARGWDGTSPDMDDVARDCRDRLSRPGAVTAHHEPLEDVVLRLRESTGLNIVIDAGIRDVGPVTATASGTMQQSLEELARAAGLGIAVNNGVVILCKPEVAQRDREAVAQAELAHRTNLVSLAKPLKAGSCTIAEFAKSLDRATGMQVMTSRDVWESGAAVAVPQGATARAALEASGFKWAVHEGRIWLVR